MNPTDLPTEQLLQMYRHVKGTLSILELMLWQRGAIKCPKCGVHHKATERHVMGQLYSMEAVSG